MAALIADTDWSATPIGPRAQWPAELRMSVGLMLDSRFPMCIGWGDELLLLYNDAYAAVLGTKHPAALGVPMRQAWAEVWTSLAPAAAQVLAGEVAHAEDLPLGVQRRGFTEETYFTFSASPMRDDAGAVAGLFCTCTETTGRVLGERRLRTLRALGDITAVVAPTVERAIGAALDALARNRDDVPGAACYVLDEGVVGEVASAHLAASYGIDPAGAALPVRLPDRDDRGTVWRVARGGPAEIASNLRQRFPRTFAPSASAVGTGAVDDALVLPITPTGAGRPVAVLTLCLSPFLELDDEYRAFLELVVGQVTTAVTDALAYQTEHRRAEELAELDRAKTEFFANISHEFRTPLTLISGPVAELRADPAVVAQPRLATELEVVAHNAQRLGKLVTTLLDFSRCHAGRQRARFEPVNLAAYTTELAALFGSAMDRAGLAYTVDCPRLPEPVYVDRDAWEKVVLNLLSNAVKFTMDGAVGVSLRHEPGWAVLDVTDSGIGIPETELGRLFERFHQVPDRRGRSAEGSGIGLALTRELVGLHGGEITARSAAGAGSTFAVRLRLGHVHLPADQVVHQPDRTSTDEVSRAAQPFLAETMRWFGGGGEDDLPAAADAHPAPDRPNVLVVDDNADMRGYLTRLLTPAYRVTTAADGAAGLAAARRELPDLIVADQMMPRMDGFGLVAAVRTDHRLAGIPVIMLSARAGQEAAVEGLDAGADDYLTKPFVAAELLARVRAQVQLSRLRRREASWRTALTAALREGFVVSDGRQVVELNDAFAAMVGYGPEGLPYSVPFPWWPDPETEPDESRLMQDAWVNFGDEDLVLPMRHRDGRRVWASVARSRLTDPKTGRELRLTTVRDVTAARATAERAEQVAHEQRQVTEQALQLLSEHADDVVARHAPDGTWRYVSPSVYRMSGWLPEQLVGCPPLEFLHPDDHGAARAALAALATGPVEVRARMRHVEGHYFWVETRAHVATDPATGEVEFQTVSRDVHDRVLAERQLERFRAVAELTTDVVGMASAAGTAFYLNPAGRALFGIAPDADGTSVRLADLTTERGGALLAAAFAEAAATGVWTGETEFAGGDGGPIPVSQVLIAHRDHRGEIEFYSTILRDLRPQRVAEAQLQAEREQAVAERAARAAADSAAARIEAMVTGLAAIVWERDLAADVVTFISDRAVELLGYPTRRWRDSESVWPEIVHAEDRAEVVRVRAEAIAAGRDFDQTYRVLAADGRTVWLHDVVHMVTNIPGTPRWLHGVMIDVTERKRAEQADTLLARVGALVGDSTPVGARLDALVEATVPLLGARAAIRVIGPDGMLHPVAIAGTAAHVLTAATFRYAPTKVPEMMNAQIEAGRAFAVPGSGEEILRELVDDDTELWTRRSAGIRARMVVPLTAHGRLLGMMSFATLGEPQGYDAADLALAEELGRRASMMIESGRIATRERQLHRITTALAATDGVQEAAHVLAAGIIEVADARGILVFVGSPQRRLGLVHHVGYGDEIAERHRRPDGRRGPVNDCFRSGAPVWLPGPDDLRGYPDVAADNDAAGDEAGVALPLRVGERIVGVLWAAFDTTRLFPLDEREFLVTLAGQAAVAMERAALADTRRYIAETLQHTLLPAAPPALERLALATRYLPAVSGVQAGGDWYDVITLDEHRTAIVVGDVVGQGAPAAAVMGLLRSALSATLLRGDGPAQALSTLNRFAARTPGARAATAVCLVVDSRAGTLTWARAGHPPPLLLDADGARYLEDAGSGPLLAFVIDDGPEPLFTEGTVAVQPGTTVLLYTDGLVERRFEPLDTGLERLADAAAGLADAAPDQVVAQLLTACLADGHNSDDVALIAARLLPGPLRQRLPARAEYLATARVAVRQWVAGAVLDPMHVDDLQLALGEACTNAVEHAYRDAAPGEFEYRVRRLPGGDVEVQVRDFGTWRPPPADHVGRGRGLLFLRAFTRDLTIDPAEHGTTVRFVVPRPPPEPAPTEQPVAEDPERRATLLPTGDPPSAILRTHADQPRPEKVSRA